MIARAVCLVAVMLMVAADKPDKAAKKEKDIDKLQGEWTMVSMETRGVKSTDEQIKGHTLTVKGDRWTFKPGNGSASTATVKLDPSKNPKLIDLLFDAPRRKVPSWGIYKLEGDTMTLCRTKGKNPRPGEFKTTADAGLLVVWKKAAAPSKDKSPGRPND